MIGTIDVKVQAHNPNFPLDPVFTFVNSSQSFRIRDVPKRIGNWSITNVFVNITYPDNTVISKECLLVGGVWVGTVNGCSSSGQVEKGFVVTASGIDENNQTVSNYVLGAGDIYVKQLDGTVTPGKTSIRMFFYETIPTSPNEGDSTFIEGVLNVYDGTQWKPVAQQSDPSYIEDSNGNKIEADRDVIYTDNTKWSVNMGSYGTYVLSQTSIYSWEYAEPEGIDGNKKVVLSYRDGENSWFLEYYQWSSSTWYIMAYGRDYESPSTATSLEITITGDTSIDCTLTRGVVITDKLATLSDLPTKTSDLTNDSGFITSSELPTKTSDLTNDSNFITSEQVEPFYNFGSTASTGTARYAACLYTTTGGSGRLDTDGWFETQSKIGTDLTPQLEAHLGYSTYYNFVLSKFFSQTYSPSLELIFWKNGSIKKLVNNRPRTYYDGCMYRTADAGFAIPCSSEGVPDGRLIEFTQVSPSYIAFTNEDTQVHTITGNTRWTSIETIDGQSGEIACTRTNEYKMNGHIEKLAKESQLPTKTSDLTNDSGFITAEQVPTPSYIEDSDCNKIEADRTFTWRTKNPWLISSMQDGYYTYDPPLACEWKYITYNVYGQTEQKWMWISVTPYQTGQDEEYIGIDPELNYVEYYTKSGDTYTAITGEVIDAYTENAITEIGQTSCTITRTAEWTTHEDKLAKLSDIPTKTSDLTNDSGFVTSTQLANKRDLSDMDVRGTPTNEGSWFNISDGTYMENAHWYDGTRWMTGATFEVDKTSTTGVFELKQFVDGSLISLGTFSLDDKYEATLTVDDVTYTIVGYVDIIATQSWVRNLIQTMLQQ